ncbi:MAG TPA: hypothetical protein DCK76_10925 [Desulfotomaculum sp.]|nr:MAG: hypothetical protein XD84_2050 [Desulfotomaculum sp. 46_80]HAG11859.1 hypothetical protein [Desulfotomaculum sp.]HBY05112.1 hypothetical protein [Desulfotomaculum sp.]
MFDLKKVLSQLNITEEYFIDKLGIPASYFTKVINEKNPEKQFELYNSFLRIKFEEELFLELGDFYGEFFPSKQKAESFIKSILSFQDSNIPRRMINSITRLISLADDIEQIRKGDFGLKIFFIVVCIEALNVLAGKKDMSKIDMLIDFFNNKISVRDRQLILDNVKRISSSERLTEENYGEYINSAVNGTIKKDIDIEEFALIINNMRNLFVHEGIGWEFTFSDGKEHAMNIIDFPQKQYRGWVNQERIYDVNLKYSDFRMICVKGLINFLREYLMIIKHNKR